MGLLQYNDLNHACRRMSGFVSMLDLVFSAGCA